MTTAEIESLLERVKAATGPDRELDADIDVTLFGGETVWKQANYTMDMYPASRRQSANHMGGYVNEHVPLFTASIDACLALIERVLPGCLWSVSRPVGYAKRRRKLPDGSRIAIPYDAFVATDDRIGEPSHKFSVDEGATAALALLTSGLSVLALLHQASDKGNANV